MIRIFKVIKNIENQVLSSAKEGERLYLKEIGLYNAYNQKICDIDSKIAEECTEEIKEMDCNKCKNIHTKDCENM